MDVIKLVPLLIVWAIWLIMKRMKKTGREISLLGTVEQKKENKPLKDNQIVKVECNGLVSASSFSRVENKWKKDMKIPLAKKQSSQVVGQKERHHHTGYFSRKLLRKAVIWSEILALPVSLRDD